MTQLTRPDLDRLPAYVAGRTVAGAIKLASNEVPYGPLPGVSEAIAEAATQTPPLPRHGRRRAAGQARRASSASTPSGSPPAAARSRWPSTWPEATCRCRRRDRLLVALVRGVPDHRGDHRGDQRAGAEHARRTVTT